MAPSSSVQVSSECSDVPRVRSSSRAMIALLAPATSRSTSSSLPSTMPDTLPFSSRAQATRVLCVSASSMARISWSRDTRYAPDST